ncbi:PSP1 domain-containing protein [Holdemania massiliensis]|uniref:PSP1 domain-containing protein n=1 Tax=Holdemania massiliensis TaxID=1468449 RepID=UPI0002E9806F|nr:regulatory iron-sulfur-containing complex subunit RicT [Holdemania massiliensis]
MSENQEAAVTTEEVKPVAPAYRFVVSVRFKNSRKAYSFGTDDETLEYGDYVVVETVRGVEMGEIISNLRDVSMHTQNTPLKPVLRKASRRDREMYAENKDLAKEALTRCQEAVARLKLDMNLISCEYTLDRSKIIFVYVADERVDFRELLKELAGIFKCRIELRQIGPRDKAKIIGGLGTCGMETCCSRFMDDFDVVSINMAKNQLLALNIQKLSGQCGKLMCCLKFEDENYKQLRAGLPKMNAQVEYEGKLYRVTSMNVINGTAKLENRENVQFIALTDLMEKGVFRRPEAQNAKNKEKEVRPERKEERKENDRKESPERRGENKDAQRREERKANDKKPAEEKKPERKEGVKRPVEKKAEKKAEERKAEDQRPERKPQENRRNQKPREGVKEMKSEAEVKPQTTEGEGKPQEHKRPNRRRRHPGRREGQPKNETGEGQK